MISNAAVSPGVAYVPAKEDHGKKDISQQTATIPTPIARSRLCHGHCSKMSGSRAGGVSAIPVSIAKQAYAVQKSRRQTGPTLTTRLKGLKKKKSLFEFASAGVNAWAREKGKMFSD